MDSLTFSKKNPHKEMNVLILSILFVKEMIGVVAIIVTLILVLVLLFIPNEWLDRVAIIIAVVALSVTAYGVWYTIPGHLQDIKQGLQSS